MFRNHKGIGVSPSPLNPVKLELVVLMIVGVLLWAVHARITADPVNQLLLLGGYGLIAMAWLMLRTRRIMARHAASPVSGVDLAARPDHRHIPHDQE